MPQNAIDHRSSQDNSGIDQFVDDRRFAQSLARGMCVLRAFRPDDGPLGNQELASRTGLSKATISRLTFTLAQLGYLERLHALEKYRLGAGVIALGNTAHATLPFLDGAAPRMQEMADELQALVAIAIPDGQGMLMTHSWCPHDSSTSWLRTGTWIPMKRSSVGLAYLASINTRDRHHLIRTRLTNSTEEMSRLYDEVEEARSSLSTNGYVPSFGRWNTSLYAVATPLRSPRLGAPYIFFSGMPADAIEPPFLTKVIGPQLARRVSQLGLM